MVSILQFITSLKYIYKNYGGMENIFENIKDERLHNSIHMFKKFF